MAGMGFLIVTFMCGAFAAAVLLLVREIRGVVIDPARPPGWGTRAAAALRSPALSGRLAAAVLLGLATLVLTRWPVAAAGVAALVALWPRLFGGTRAERTRLAKLEALVVWTETLRDTVAGHASLEQAIPATAGTAPPLLRPALVRLMGQMRARMPLDRGLLGLAAELDDPSADVVIAALMLNTRRRGDRLTEVLSGLATTAREELDMRRRIDAGRAGTRRDVTMIVVMTVAMAVALPQMSPDYTRPYLTLTGQAVLTVVIAVFAAGFNWLRRLTSHSAAEPLLTRPGRRADPAEQRVVSTLTGTVAATHPSGGDSS